MFAPAKNASQFALARSAEESGVRTSDAIMNIVAPKSGGGALGGQGGGALLGGIASLGGQFLPPQARPLLSAGQFVMSGGMSSLMSGNPSALLGLSGIASQFLPPYAGDALAAGQMLMSGASPMQMMQGLMGRFLPPELQGVWSAAQAFGGIQGVFSSGAGPTIAGAPSTPTVTAGGAPFAARVGDLHSCPMSEGPKPHLGGPILPPGCITVRVGNQPAARISDKATCVGPPDMICQGEETVLIGGLPAARVGDSTLHGGKIIQGLPTVMIGKRKSAADCAAAAAQSGSGLVQEAPPGAAATGNAASPPAASGIPEKNPATPGDAPGEITLAPELNKQFGQLWNSSFPNGNSQEYGGTLVRNSDGSLSLVNTGGGTSGSFSPNRNAGSGQKIEGVFHTHPYDASEGGHTNVSLSGGDAAYMINKGDKVIIAQSGEGQFMYLRTDKTPANVDYTAMNNQQNARVGQLVGQGHNFDEASRIAAKENAQNNGMAYYEGKNGKLARVSP